MNVLIATINIYSSLPPRRNATRLFTRVLQLSTHRFTKRNEREREGKRKKNSTLIFHGLFPPIRDGRAWTLSSISHDWYSIHRPKQISIRRIGQQSRGSLLDYDPFSMEGKRYGRIFTESMSCRTRPHEGNWREHRNYCRRRCNNIQPIVSGRAASTRDLLFCTAGSLMRESRDTRDRKPPPFRGTTRFFIVFSRYVVMRWMSHTYEES